MSSKNMTSILTGVAATMAVGTAAYLLNSNSSSARKKQLKKKTGQAIQAVGDVVDGITTMMK